MQSDLILLLGAILGIVTHNLVKIDSLNRNSNGNFKFLPFIRLEWPSISISVIVVVVALFAKSEIAQLENAGKWLVGGFFSIGYMAQDFLYKFMGKAKKTVETITGEKSQEDDKVSQ